MGLAASPAWAQTDSNTARHVRILGVFDMTTGAPIEGAVIRDMASGLSVTTTATGTAGLFFIDTTRTLLRITKLGYRVAFLPLDNSPRDTTPITFTLEPMVTTLPAVVSRAEHARGLQEDEDIGARLTQVGFFDRQLKSGAPLPEFVTAAQLSHWSIETLNDVPSLTGRPLCQGNLYVDGVRIDVPRRIMGPGRVSRRFQSGADDFLPISDIAGIENYNSAEMPIEYRRPDMSCVTLVWTR